MLQRQRQDKILESLSGDGFLSVADAVRIFNSSPATLRRDFAELAESGQAIKVRGGLKASNGGGMLPFSARAGIYSAEKEALAESAAAMIKSGDVVLHMAGCLPDMNIRIITNSLRLASVLEEMKAGSRWEIYLTGGFLYTKSGILLGPNALYGIAQYHADLAFLSASGIDESGVYNSSELVVETERVMIGNSDKVVIMADHSKIGKRGLCKVCDIGKISGIITDKNVSSRKSLNLIRKKGIEITLVDM
ncbi:MAG: DeoR/GlpR family DNA-binding transcription regulator [Lentisphaerae bacterium]|nr:DeoR/GlpR family DNA-binding transcription regulator [Lentisphaerota bacterium]